MPAVPTALGVPRPEGVLTAPGDADVVVAADGWAGRVPPGSRVVRWALEPWDVALPTLTPIAEHAELLRALAPGLPVEHVPAGLEPAAATAAPADGPLRVLVVAGAAALAQVREPVREVASPAQADVVLDLSRREVPPGPSLAGAAHGAVPVVTAAAGREEHVAHGADGLVVAWDDPRGAARTLDLLARDRVLLARLRAGALARAAARPSPDEADALVAAALARLLAAPALDPGDQGAALARWRALEATRGRSRAGAAPEPPAVDHERPTSATRGGSRAARTPAVVLARLGAARRRGARA